MSKHKLDDVSGVKQDKKRRKKDRKEALKYEDITPPSTEATAESTPVPEDSAYVQSSDLNALSDSTISDFYAAENVQVTDPQSTSLQPVLQFSHLPVQILDTFSPLFSKFSKPSSIQSTTWPHLLSSRDIVGIAETGSGKTLAFGLPLVQRLLGLKKKNGIRAVVIAPTRELAIQVFEQIDSLCKVCKDASLKAACVYGGTNKDEQRAKLKGANVVVATPGRLKDFMGDGTIDVAKVKYLVLDEADRMLDKGFEEDIKAIIGAMPGPSTRQTAMFTATWPRSVMELAATFMREPVRVTIGRNGGSNDDGPDGELRANPRIKQVVEVMDGAQKSSRLLSLLREHTAGKKKNDRILVFCLYKKEATRIEGLIRTNRFAVAGIHGDLSQPQREKSLGSFKEGQVNVLVATDVAARGLDIPEVKVVINVTFPLTAEDYVHRIGRTGRAGKDGLAITFFTEQDKGLAGGLVNVLKGAGQPVPEDLLKFGTTVKKKQHDVYGAFYKDDMAGKTSTKVTFDD